MLQFITCGESHGPQISAILEGLPSGVSVDFSFINHELWRRQQGFGRGGRQRIETDQIKITAGIYNGKTTGAPLGLVIENRDFKIQKMPQLFRPRPGHVDLAGALKYHEGIREILERASARETAVRVAIGAVAKLFLKPFEIEVVSHVTQIGKAKLEKPFGFDEIKRRRPKSEVACVSEKTERAMIQEIRKAMAERNTVGGKFEVVVRGVPIGLGSHVHYTRKLDARIALGLMSMQSVKAVEIGLGTEAAEIFGSLAHDEIFYSKKQGYYHKTNRAGGFTGGITNGSEISVTATMKPISTLRRELRSVNMKTKKAEKADFERSDVCAVPAGSVIGESIVAYEIADALLEKFGGDSISETLRNFKSYKKTLH